MISFLGRFREPLLIGALIVLPLVSFLSTGGRGREPNFFDRMVLAVASPLQSAMTWALSGSTGVVSGYVSLRGAHQEAAECRAQLAQTRAELNGLTEARGENLRLKEALRYVESAPSPAVMAKVIGLNASPQFRSFRIDRGEDDGVRVGMPVASADGVVGHVVRSVAGSADVMLMTDPKSRIGALVQRTRVRGTVFGAGDGQRMQIDYVRREDDIAEGDVVVTAGTDGIFPRGLVIGTVQSVTRPTAAVFIFGAIEPQVNLMQVEEVLVLPSIGLSAMRTVEGAR